MNYRHAYHAGNFADVLKHACLALAIEHLKLKPAPFRVIDTHAGAGLYDLDSAASLKTGEWRGGIGSLLAEPVPGPVEDLLAPYVRVVRELNAADRLERYPGSPLLARRLMRRSDVLIANELHPEDHESLSRLLAGDPQVKVMQIDAWTALKALLPPKERRGVVLIDPPFEEAGELERMALGLKASHRRFATGTVLLWYPVKDTRPVAAFHSALRELGLPRMLVAELFIKAPKRHDELSGTGLVLLNPPFTLEEKLKVLLPFLADRLARGKGAFHRLEWLTGERVNSS
jgi:23S rRNA (adenine2030-N6)-methyltransferase